MSAVPVGEPERDWGRVVRLSMKLLEPLESCCAATSGTGTVGRGVGAGLGAKILSFVKVAVSARFRETSDLFRKLSLLSARVPNRMY